MRATYMFSAGDVRVIDVPDPALQQPTDALVRIVRACVCGTTYTRTTACPSPNTARRWATNSSASSKKPATT
ncbi:hypothetical protein Areg01_34670 [Actinoplanes regularis]|nr:hypothetical protein Areg01_34670 [Actinoplanes regularis]